MKTVEVDMKTFEVFLGLAGERRGAISMSDFLSAHPDFCYPIPEDRLKEILVEAETKSDLPKLWLIVRGYSYLRDKCQNDSCEILERLTLSKIEEVIDSELELPANRNMADAKTLYEASLQESESRKKAEKFYRAVLEAFLDESADKSCDDLLAVKEYFHKDFADLLLRFEQAVSEKAIRESKNKTDQWGIWFSVYRIPIPSELNKAVIDIIDKIDDVGVINQIAMFFLRDSDLTVDESFREVQEKIWDRVFTLITDKQELLKIVRYDPAGMARILKTFASSLTRGELQDIDLHTPAEWEGSADQSLAEMVKLLEAAYNNFLATAKQSDAFEVYLTDWIGKAQGKTKERDWRSRVRLSAVRRLYELSQSK